METVQTDLEKIIEETITQNDMADYYDEMELERIEEQPTNDKGSLSETLK